jgi:predicted HNH restriction endonuclease
MPYKDPEVRKAKQKVISDTWYSRNRETHKARQSELKKLARDKWMAYKATKKCQHCGVQHPALIDFHHIIRDETKESVYKLLKNSLKKAIEEAETKCIPLCSNCHRLLHHKENDQAVDRHARHKARKKKKEASP